MTDVGVRQGLASPERIRVARYLRGLTQRQVAAAAVSAPSLSRIEACPAHPSAAVLRGLSDVLDAPVDELLAGASLPVNDVRRLVDVAPGARPLVEL